VIEEPPGAAHRDPDRAAELVREWCVKQLDELVTRSPEELVAGRYERFRKLGAFTEEAPVMAAGEGAGAGAEVVVAGERTGTPRDAG
jgi:hypothetical protein